MQVQNNPAYTSPLNTREAYASRTGADAEHKTTDADSTRAAVTSTTAQTPNNAVTGTTGNRLSAETFVALLNETHPTAGTSGETQLSEATRNKLDQVAKDPDYAAKQVEWMGGVPRGIIISSGVLPFPGNNASLAEKEAFLGKMDHINAIRDAAIEPFSAFYENAVQDDLPPAQTYARLLQFQAGQNEFNNLSDQMVGRSEGHTTNELKAEYAYLQQAIAQAGEFQ